MRLQCGITLLFCLSAVSCARPVPHPRGETTVHAAHRPEELVDAATKVIGFLQGRVGAGEIHLADTVALHLAPGGGGGQTRIPREQLRDPAAWVIRARDGAGTYRIAPPNGHSVLATRVGEHFNCHPSALARVSEELARLPHVGTRLQPPGAESCLQSWNATLVFDPNRRPATLVAVLYDQWEW
jgi:hypothetical protein